MRINIGNLKIFTLLAVMAMLGFNAMAQNVIEVKDTKPYFAIEVSKMNVLYAGLPNPVKIATSVAAKKLHIDWGGATARYRWNGQYDVEVPVSLVGRELTISVSAEKKNGKIQNLGSCVFRVKSIPEPAVYIGGNITGGQQPKDAILANPFISVRMLSDFNYHLRWQVLCYDVTFGIDGIVEPTITVEGAQFSEEVINKIKDAPSCTFIEFSEFKIQSIAGYREFQKSIAIRIVDTYEDECESIYRNSDIDMDIFDEDEE
jgi:hypothetical protein